ncbi:MAG: hypothetical protein B6242_12630 [Anaerolineaceae bacterium 4572_78]|nr:MAG: hypothetical protein B6242_12630 [Anaerolineaceae bacterium 4572_78]
MEITLITPPYVVQQNVKLHWSQLSAKAIEVLIVELYRVDYITFKQAQRLLNTTWQDTLSIFKKHNCQEYYDSDDFEDDVHTLDSLYGEEA